MAISQGHIARSDLGREGETRRSLNPAAELEVLQQCPRPAVFVGEVGMKAGYHGPSSLPWALALLPGRVRPRHAT